jgi:two-component system KDP operon response regulator KdpE
MTRQKNILLIEGDLMVRQALGQALTVENYRVVPARNQQEALREFSRQPSDQPIDLVLLDLNPTNENAWETVKRLTALEPNLPVVAMTGRLEEHDSISISSAPVFDALMEKPLNVLLLLKTLNDLTLETRELRRRGRLPRYQSKPVPTS